MRRREPAAARGSESGERHDGTNVRAGGGGKNLLLAPALLALAVAIAIVAADFTAPASAQSDETTGRIVARQLANGRVEFGWQPASGARVLPQSRYFPADAQVGRWLRSSAVEVDGAELGRINARLLSDGRIEFAFTPTDGERILPPSRYFPTNARAGRWLRSTEITITSLDTNQNAFIDVSAGAGGLTCALRESGAIECWGGDNEYGQTDAPEGSFTAVSAGGGHACAIRTNGEIACWGRNSIARFDARGERTTTIETGQTGAPEGSFTAVSAGAAHTCAIRTNGEIACWGYGGNGQTAIPAGRFIAVSAGGGHTCAIRTNGAIRCWGYSGEYGSLTRSPDGSFTTVSAGRFHTCAIHTSGETECWGDSAYSVYGTVITGTPVGSFTAVSVSALSYDEGYACAIRASDSAIRCWGGSYDSDQTAPPAGRYTAVSAGRNHACAIRTNGEIVCWGRGQAKTPAGSFTAVSSGGGHICAIRTNGEIACWGDNRDRQAEAPAGRFTAVSSGGGYTCAIRTNGEIACWGWGRDNEYGQTDAPAGRYTALSAGWDHTCAIRASDSAITCWGSIDTPPAGSYTAISSTVSYSCGLRDIGEADVWEIVCWGGGQYESPPVGGFIAVSVGAVYRGAGLIDGYGCAIRTNGAIECWGDNEYGQTDAPEGSYTAVSDTCAIRDDGEIVCWGGGEVGYPYPDGSYTAISGGCAIRANDGAIVCLRELEGGVATTIR